MQGKGVVFVTGDRLGEPVAALLEEAGCQVIRGPEPNLPAPDQPAPNQPAPEQPAPAQPEAPSTTDTINSIISGD